MVIEINEVLKIIKSLGSECVLLGEEVFPSNAFVLKKLNST